MKKPDEPNGNDCQADATDPTADRRESASSNKDTSPAPSVAVRVADPPKPPDAATTSTSQPNVAESGRRKKQPMPIKLKPANDPSFVGIKSTFSLIEMIKGRWEMLVVHDYQGPSKEPGAAGSSNPALLMPPPPPPPPLPRQPPSRGQKGRRRKRGSRKKVAKKIKPPPLMKRQFMKMKQPRATFPKKYFFRDPTLDPSFWSFRRHPIKAIASSKPESLPVAPLVKKDATKTVEASAPCTRSGPDDVFVTCYEDYPFTENELYLNSLLWHQPQLNVVIGSDGVECTNEQPNHQLMLGLEGYTGSSATGQAESSSSEAVDETPSTSGQSTMIHDETDLGTTVSVRQTRASSKRGQVGQVGQAKPTKYPPHWEHARKGRRKR